MNEFVTADVVFALTVAGRFAATAEGRCAGRRSAR
jgi:hypothetical protein